MIRLFAALALPGEIVGPLMARQGGLTGARWSPPENLHITLRFFGDLAEDVAADLDAALSGVEAPSFDMALAGVGCFGEGAAIDSVWAGVEGAPGLLQLARACEGAARRCGLRPDIRNYHPHVTLAYLRRPDPAAVAAWIQAQNLLRSPPFRAERFGLYSSWRGRAGSRYRLERIYALGGEARSVTKSPRS